VDKGN